MNKNTYRIYYKGKDANWPEFEAATEEEALQAWAEKVAAVSGEEPAEILAEDWPSPQGVKKCAEARKV